MAHQSAPRFLVLHALRVKGFAPLEVLVELTELAPEVVQGHLDALQQDDLVLFREGRGLWQLSPAGRSAHAEALAADLAGASCADDLRPRYDQFLLLNEPFKELCGEWQLRNGEPNDHADAAYDAAVIGRLLEVDSAAQPVCHSLGDIMARYAPYGPRLQGAAARVQAGDHRLFTGVMCGSYHDVWMELHEDLILTLGVDRTKEGSF